MIKSLRRLRSCICRDWRLSPGSYPKKTVNPRKRKEDKDPMDAILMKAVTQTRDQSTLKSSQSAKQSFRSLTTPGLSTVVKFYPLRPNKKRMKFQLGALRQWELVEFHCRRTKAAKVARIDFE